MEDYLIKMGFIKSKKYTSEEKDLIDKINNNLNYYISFLYDISENWIESDSIEHVCKTLDIYRYKDMKLMLEQPKITKLFNYSLNGCNDSITRMYICNRNKSK